MKKIFKLIATATFGLEAIVKREVEALGYSIIETFNGGVVFNGDLEAIKRCNLWLRSADRVLLEVGRFKAYTFDELYEKTKELPWEDFIPKEGEFPVVGKSIKSLLYSVSDCQRIVKKAVSMRLGEKYKRIWLEETGAYYKISVALLKDEVTLTLDTTGPGLHKRGYRFLNGNAPLKETLAAALVDLSYYNKDRILYDPFCGTGTILIEAAMKELKIAPGLKRDFVCQGWNNLGNMDFSLVKEEATSLIRDDKLEIFGSDLDGEQLGLARAHLEKVGLKDKVFLQKLDFKDFRSKKKFAVMITNPPYGERLGSMEEVAAIYRELGKFKREHDDWSMYILTAYQELEQVFRNKATRRRKLYNGTIECTYYQYLGPRPPLRKE